MFYSFFNRGPVSLLSIVTGYYLDGPGILSQLGRDFPHISRPARPWSPPSLLYNGYRVFLSWKVRPGRAADHSPPSSTAVKKEYSYTSTPPMGRTACTEPQCLYSRAIPLLPLWTVRRVQNLSACTVQLYLYSPQCLYSTAIPLLPLWTVRPVQSLSACTVQLYLYSANGPYSLYRALVPLQRRTLLPV